MRVAEVSFLKRVTTARYEHEEVSVVMSLAEGDSGEKGIQAARTLAYSGLNLGPTVAKVAKTVSASATTSEKTTTETKAVKTAAPTKAATPTTKPAKAKVEKKVVTSEEVLVALRAYAEKKDSKEMAMAVIEDVTGKKKLVDVDPKHYAKLVKALAV